MEKNKSIIEDAHSYIDEFEKGTKVHYLTAWFTIIFGMICIAFLLFGYQKATKIETYNQAIIEKFENEKLHQMLSTIVDSKITLLRAELEVKLKSNTLGIVGGGLLGLGIGHFFNMRQRKRQAKIMRGLLNFVDKNS